MKIRKGIDIDEFCWRVEKLLLFYLNLRKVVLYYLVYFLLCVKYSEIVYVGFYFFIYFWFLRIDEIILDILVMKC